MLKNRSIKTAQKIQASIIIAFIIATIVSVAGFASECEVVRKSFLRMHVVANSDSEFDQQLKLKVRDAVLQQGKELFDGSATSENAAEKLSKEIGGLEAAAKKIIEENGFDYPVKIEVVNEYFNTRSYEEITLPAGEYTAVKVVIGAGQGQNWWCVMFPPLCLPAVSVNDNGIDAYLEEEEISIVEAVPEYEPRFKIVEIYERIKTSFWR